MNISGIFMAIFDLFPVVLFLVGEYIIKECFITR